MRRFLAIIMALAALAGTGAPAAALQFGDPVVEASLITDAAAVAPGDEFHVALRLVMPDGWHTYWRNPGDSGEPTRIEWDLPEGFEAGDFVWPAPKAFPFGPLVNYGYDYEVVLPAPFMAPASLGGEAVVIRARATWLVCEDICIPESGSFELTIPVSETPESDRPGAARIARALSLAPGADAEVLSGLTRDGGDLLLTAAGGEISASEEIRNAYFFPYQSGMVDHAAAQAVFPGPEGLALRLAPGRLTRQGAVPATPGALVFEGRQDGRWVRTAIELAPEPGAAVFEPPAAAIAAGPAWPGFTGLMAGLALAFLGGLVLNLMPCVFPVLSIKALGFVEKAHSGRAEIRRHGLIFLAGVLIAFLVLALVLTGLKALGQPVGWGFQLQSPLVVTLLSLLFFTIGLNLMGAFEAGGALQRLGGRFANVEGDAGAFLTGLLAVVVAAPCIGPFAAATLGLAMTQPAPVLILISLMLGLGLAAPYVLLSFNPGLLERLPRPGPWMVRFKQLLAFPMFAAAVWLIWVLSIQTGPAGVLLALAAALAVAFAVWAGRGGSRLGKAGVVLGLVLAVLAIVALTGVRAEREIAADAWSEARVAELRAEGRPIFVEFTAAWCVSCQVNKQMTLQSRPVRAAFAEHDVAVLTADWTDWNDDIARALAAFGAAGVPLYVVYPADGGEPAILPPVINNAMIIEALENAAG